MCTHEVLPQDPAEKAGDGPEETSGGSEKTFDWSEEAVDWGEEIGDGREETVDGRKKTINGGEGSARAQKTGETIKLVAAEKSAASAKGTEREADETR